jgi:MoaA/NifB/PqqE/SkfB family radical SAM enzyme
MDGIRKMKPNPNNACSGKYSDWLEVNLLPECNAKCPWCIEKKGWHPTNEATYHTIVNAAIASGKKNVILLGGEPTLYLALKLVVRKLVDAGINVYLTTNGSMLSKSYVENILTGIKGINISIHHWDLKQNEKLTGINLNMPLLKRVVEALHSIGAKVRLNCNCMKGYISGVVAIHNYIDFAKELGVDSVRFAELKDDDENFVNLAKLLKGYYGLTDDPFANGCSINTTITGMPVNFRLMCGLQTNMRPKPVNPEQTLHPVLYYDGNMYEGWQIRGHMKGDKMDGNEIRELLRKVKKGEVGVVDAAELIKEAIKTAEQNAKKAAGKKSEPLIIPHPVTGSGCAY